MTNKVVKWDTSKNIGAVSSKAILKGLPEQITVQGNEVIMLADDWPSVFETVDTHREHFLAKITTEAMDYAEKNNVGDGTGMGVSIPKINMLGQAKADVYINPFFMVTSEVHFQQTETMETVLNRSGELFAKWNITPPDADD